MQPSLQGARRSDRAIAVSLDGLPVQIPENRHSLVAIRSYLETLAMERQHVLCSFCVDGQPLNPSAAPASFSRIEAESIALDEMPLQLLRTARLQVAAARERTLEAVSLVLINDVAKAREYWWGLAQHLREPLLTLALMPDNSAQTSGGASPAQLRRWQLQQLAVIIHAVDDACDYPEAVALSTALENRVLPWLEKLHDSIVLWEETLNAGWRLSHAA